MPAKKLTIEAIILEQMTLEPSVATMPPAAITVSAAASGLVNADIKYVDSQTGSQSLLSFSVGT